VSCSCAAVAYSSWLMASSSWRDSLQSGADSATRSFRRFSTAAASKSSLRTHLAIASSRLLTMRSLRSSSSSVDAHVEDGEGASWECDDDVDTVGSSSIVGCCCCCWDAFSAAAGGGGGGGGGGGKLLLLLLLVLLLLLELLLPLLLSLELLLLLLLLSRCCCCCFICLCLSAFACFSLSAAALVAAACDAALDAGESPHGPTEHLTFEV